MNIGYIFTQQQHYSPPISSHQDFVLKLLEKDPAKRMTAEGAAEHRWFKNGPGDLASNDLSENILLKIKLCNLKRKLKDAIRLVNG